MEDIKNNDIVDDIIEENNSINIDEPTNDNKVVEEVTVVKYKKGVKRFRSAYVWGPILGTIAVAGAIVPPLILKPVKKAEEPTVVVEKGSTTGVAIKQAHIVLHQESTVTLDIPQTKEIKTLVVKVGDNTLSEGSDYTVQENTVKIVASAMNSVKVSLKVNLKDKAVPVTQITVTADKDSIKVGEQLQYTAHVLPESATLKEVEWSVYDPKCNGDIARIDSNGLLKAIQPGTVMVKALAKDGSGVYGEKELKITQSVHVTEIKFTRKSISINAGEIKTFDELGIQVLPENATDKSYTISCDDKRITVDNENKIITSTGELASQIVLTATSNDQHLTANANIDIVNYLEFIQIGDTDECEVKGRGDWSVYPDTIQIPKYANVEGKVGTFKVVKIANEGFAYQSFSTSTYPREIIISDTVREIGDCAFFSSSIKSVNFPESIEKIGGGAFWSYCYFRVIDLSKTKITELEPFNSGGRNYGCFESAFDNPKHMNVSSRINAIILPNSLKKIGEACFAYHSNLCIANLNDGLECIEKNAFARSRIDKVVIPESVNHIATAAFAGGEKETPYSIKYLKFSGNNPNLIIEPDAFWNNYGLAEVEIESSVVANLVQTDQEDPNKSGIFDLATTIKIDKSITVNDSAWIKNEMSPFKNFTSSELSGDNFNYYERRPTRGSFVWDNELDGWIWKDTLVYAPTHCPNFLTYEDEETGEEKWGKVKKVDFYESLGPDVELSWVHLPNTIEYISDKCFYHAKAGSQPEHPGISINYPKNLKSIGQEAFAKCISMLEQGIVSIPKSCVSIASKAFYNYQTTVMIYEGTMAEWELIEKGQDWFKNDNDPEAMNEWFYGIICSDGVIKVTF